MCSMLDYHTLPGFDSSLPMKEQLQKKTSKRGCDVGSTNNKSTKVNEEAIKAIASYVDLIHSQGGSVNSTIINGMLCDKFAFDVHQTTISRIMTKLGLSWAPIKHKPRTFAAHRHEHLRNFLIKLDSYTKEINEGNSRELLFVYTDESYIHQNHQMGKTYLNKHEQKEGVDKKKKSKGRCLVILHAISPLGLYAQEITKGNR